MVIWPLSTSNVYCWKWFGAIDQKEVDGSVHDQYRIDYLKEHIQEMKKAVDIDGVDLLGYTVWGCIDCVSFSTGEMKNVTDLFMLIKIMMVQDQLKRSKKDSFEWYKKSYWKPTVKCYKRRIIWTNYFLQLKKDIPNDIGWIRRILSYAFDWYIGGMIASLPVIVIYMMLHQDATYIPQNLSIFHAPYNIIAGSLSFIVASGY